MLILVAVTISILINSGIIGKAQKAKQDTQSAYEQESRLGDSINIDGAVYNGIDEYMSKQKTLVQAYKDGDIKIGDYVNYTNPTSGQYSYTYNDLNQEITITNSLNQLNWRVLGLTEDESSVKLIAATPVKLEGDVPYIKGANEEVLDRVSKLYKNEKAKDARSVSLDDFVQAFGINILETGGYLSELEEVTEVDETTGDEWITLMPKPLEETELLKLLFKGTKLYQGGNQGMYTHVCGAFYYVSNNIGKSIIATARLGDEELAYSQLLIMADQAFCYGGIRPVIILNENVTTEEISKIENKNEEEWNYEIGWYIVCLDENGTEIYNQY